MQKYELEQLAKSIVTNVVLFSGTLYLATSKVLDPASEKCGSVTEGPKNMYLDWV